MNKKWLNDQVNMMLAKKYSNPLKSKGGKSDMSDKPGGYDVVPLIIDKTVDLIKFKGKSKK